jgi:iron complex transport system substrate-binding protein
MQSKVALSIVASGTFGRVLFRSRLALSAIVPFVAILALSGSVRAQSVVRDDRGVSVALAGPPERIVSLLPSLTESVCALGFCARLVGTDRLSNWPASVAALPKIGGTENAQLEGVVALKPDVVLVSSSARLTARLERRGLKVIALHSRNHADAHRMLELLAQMFGVPPEAERLWSSIERETTAAAARVPASLRHQRVYFELDATPHGAGPGSFIDETLTRLGLRNALPPQLGPFPRLKPAYLVKLQPDLIMATQPALAEMSKRPGWKSLRALGEHRTCGFPAERHELIIRPGPRMGEAAGILADCLVSITKAP